MAGIATSFNFNPLPSRPAKSSKDLSTSDSKQLGFQFRCHSCYSCVFSLHSPSSSSRRSFSVVARYGGGGGGSRYGTSRRNESDGDEALLDISSIRSDMVRLIDQKQNMVGIVTRAEAIQMAEDAELDLVILSPDADPPVLRIMDYSKYKYEQQKKKKVQQKKTTRMDLKELKMGYNIDQHDYSVRLRAAKKFLNNGDKILEVKVMVNLKGRENEFRKIAIELIKRFQTDVGELANEESKNLRDRSIFIVLVPNKAVLQKSQESVKKKEKSAPSEDQLVSELAQP